MIDALLYEEKLASNWTEALFLALTSLCFLLFIWRVAAGSAGGLAAVFLCLFAVFLFYSVNYRTLHIRLTPEALRLTFGLFTWRAPLDNVEACSLDDLPWLQKYGGAGIHFIVVRGRYRASFNFLEYPRVVITFKRAVGPVRDISFSTRWPEEVLRLIQVAIAAKHAQAGQKASG